MPTFPIHRNIMEILFHLYLIFYVVISSVIFLLRKLASGLFVSSFFILMSAQAGIVEPVYKQLKDPNLDGANNVPSTVSLSITPNGKKIFVLDHLKILIQ